MEQNNGSLSVELLLALGLISTILAICSRIVFSLQDAVVSHELFTEARSIAELDAAMVTQFRGPAHLFSGSQVAAQSFALQRTVTFSTLCTSFVAHKVSWEIPRPKVLALKTILASTDSVLDSGQDCPIVGLSDNWTHPTTLGAFSTLSRIQYHGVDVVQRQDKRIAAVVGSSTQMLDSDLFLIDVTTPASPKLLSQLDTGGGLFAVDVAGSYAYAAAKSSTGQFQVIDITIPDHPVRVAAKTLPGVTGSFPEGRSIFVFRNRAYVGTYETAGSEFHIFDITDPRNPVFMGSRAVNHSIRQIVVREERLQGNPQLIAYLASSANTSELQILNVSNPGAITDIGGYDAAGNGSATALHAAGEILWMARQQAANEPGIVSLQTTDPSHPVVRTSYNVGLKAGSVVNGLAVSGAVLSLTTTDTAAPLVICNLAEGMIVGGCNKFIFFTNPGRVDFQDDLIFIPAANTLLVVGKQ